MWFQTADRRLAVSPTDKPRSIAVLTLVVGILDSLSTAVAVEQSPSRLKVHPCAVYYCPARCDTCVFVQDLLKASEAILVNQIAPFSSLANDPNSSSNISANPDNFTRVATEAMHVSVSHLLRVVLHKGFLLQLKRTRPVGEGQSGQVEVSTDVCSTDCAAAALSCLSDMLTIGDRYSVHPLQHSTQHMTWRDII